MTKRMIAAALLASAATVSQAQPAQVRTDGPNPMLAAPAPVPAPAPVAPAPDPARLAAAERLVSAMWPEELMAEVMTAAIDEHMPRIAPNPRDPNGAERARLTREATASEYTRVIRTLAPEVRSLAARFYARRLGVAELDDAARFYSGAAGRRLLRGSLELGRHAEAFRDFHPQPTPELIAAAMRLGQRIETETRHLAPPPPPPPSPAAAGRERRRPETRSSRRHDRQSSVDMPTIDVAPSPAPPPPPPADPARLAAASRALAAMLPDEAFRQPLPLDVVADTVMALPVSSFGPIPLPGVAPNASIGQAIEAHEPRAQERIRIVARILREELPTLGPLAAPMLRDAAAQLYARTFTVAELDDVTRFYETPSGRALARESFTAISDPDFVRGLILITPRAVTEGMGAMVRIGQATAHLPPPPPEVVPAPPAPPRRNRN